MLIESSVNKEQYIMKNKVDRSTTREKTRLLLKKYQKTVDNERDFQMNIGTYMKMPVDEREIVSEVDSMHLLNLPTDVLLEIMGYLQVIDIIR